MNRPKTKLQKTKLIRPIVWFAGLRSLALIFFGALLAIRCFIPKELVFDEIHYIPAAKALFSFTDNINWVHPPFAKLIMGLFWLIFTKTLNLIAEPYVFRLIASGFGLWSLWCVHAWMRALGFNERAAQAAMWLTGFNFLWFVQSKTGMLDIFYLAFAMWGVLYIYRSKHFFLGWLFLGFSFSCKWAAAPFFLIAIVLARRSFVQTLTGFIVSGLGYCLTFVPLMFLKANAVPAKDIFYKYQITMLKGFESINSAQHPYISKWWQWPTLLRPMWYTFEPVPGVGERCIWAGGNPALYWLALPLIFVITWYAIKKKDKPAIVLSLLYWLPLLFWAITPRKLQMYYYYLAPSMFVGPIVVWAHERFYQRFSQTKGWLLLGFVILCAALFLYFLPIMDGRVLPVGRYYHYMWFRSWI